MNTNTAIRRISDPLSDLSKTILNGATLEQALDHIYERFHPWIPYDRIGFAEVDEANQIARAVWHRSNDRTLLRKNYSAPLAGSSLSLVIARRQPRILNDLPAYLEHRPNSRSTALIVKEGIKSSMTCPLFVKNKPIGIIFFSSRDLDTYFENDIQTLREIATQLAMLLMISQKSATLEVIKRIEAPAQHPKASNKLLLSQLKPGMVLEAPIKSDGKLLLAIGTELTVQAIVRLDLLHAKGMLESSQIEIDRRYVF